MAFEYVPPIKAVYDLLAKLLGVRKENRLARFVLLKEVYESLTDIHSKYCSLFLQARRAMPDLGVVFHVPLNDTQRLMLEEHREQGDFDDGRDLDSALFGFRLGTGIQEAYAVQYMLPDAADFLGEKGEVNSNPVYYPRNDSAILERIRLVRDKIAMTREEEEWVRCELRLRAREYFSNIPDHPEKRFLITVLYYFEISDFSDSRELDSRTLDDYIFSVENDKYFSLWMHRSPASRLLDNLRRTDDPSRLRGLLGDAILERNCHFSRVSTHFRKAELAVIRA